MMDGENRLSSWVALGAALAGVAVMMGAIAAHGIESHLAKSYEGQTRKTVGMEIPAAQKYLADFKTASRYQMSHALGMIVVGLLATRRRSKLLTVAGWAFLIGICLFSGNAWDVSDVVAQLDASIGGGWTPDKFLETGERIWNMERIFNMKAGFTAADDTLPKRLLETPAPSGNAKGRVNELGKMLPEYYELRGWTPDGSVTTQTRDRLGVPSLG